MSKTILVPHDANILHAPTLEQVCTYLDESPMWNDFIPQEPHCYAGQKIGWVCIKNDDLGEPIRIIDQVSGHDNGVWYKTESILDLLTAIEDISIEELVKKIKKDEN